MCGTLTKSSWTRATGSVQTEIKYAARTLSSGKLTMIYRLYINLTFRNQPPKALVPIDEQTTEVIQETMADFKKCGRTSTSASIKFTGCCNSSIRDTFLEQAICRPASRQRPAYRVPTHVCHLPSGEQGQGLRWRGQPHRQKQGGTYLA